MRGRRSLSQRMDEAEARVSQVEGWAEEATEALCTCLEQQRKLQIKVLDLESRSRRNNMRVFGVPEGQEGDSVMQFIEKLLRSQLQLPEDFNFKIQRAHRALASKPPPGASPRAVIVNFLEFSTKEMILREVWKKRQDTSGRREYNAIKKILKDKGIRFQTPFTNMRIHWETGVRTYSSTREAYKELKRRGFQQEHDKFKTLGYSNTFHSWCKK
uniref:L1 transposable element RRM domain-containing protein n=1 Tax=Cyprinus carpio carpio TaxID=630221 RepID=A0A9J8DG03_CYPCA